MEKRHETLLTALCDAMCEYEAGCSLRIHHFLKVHAFARQIGLRQELPEETQFILEAAALAHDIGIKPAIEQTGACPGPLQERLGPPVAEPMLRSLGFDEQVISRVCFLIGHHHTTVDVEGVDWRILLEADYLVNSVENSHTPAQIEAFRKNVFRTP